MNEIDDLGRCECCGSYILEVELESVEITDNELGKTTEYLWCERCIRNLTSIKDPNQPRYKRTRPERKTDV